MENTKTLEDAFEEKLLEKKLVINGKTYYSESYVDNIAQTAKNRGNVLKRIKRALDTPFDKELDRYKMVWNAALIEAFNLHQHEKLSSRDYSEKLNELITNLDNEQFLDILRKHGVRLDIF